MGLPARTHGQAGNQKGGTFLAVQEQWRAEMHKVKTDNREWGVCDEGDAAPPTA